MLTSISFLIDENLPADAATAFQEAGYDVLYIRESAYRGSPDYILWGVAAREDRVIVTKDLGFPLPTRPAPPGLLLVRVPDRYNRSQIGAFIREFIRTFDLRLVRGRVVVIAPGRTPRYHFIDTL